LGFSKPKENRNVPAETFTKFQVSFYSDPVDAVYKALGVK
jgi:ATP-dependent Lon protease